MSMTDKLMCMEHWWNDNEWVKTPVLREKPVTLPLRPL